MGRSLLVLVKPYWVVVHLKCLPIRNSGEYSINGIRCLHIPVSVTSRPAGVSTSLFASPMSITFCNFTCNILGLIHVSYIVRYIYNIYIYTHCTIYIIVMHVSIHIELYTIERNSQNGHCKSPQFYDFYFFFIIFPINMAMWPCLKIGYPPK